MSAIISRATWGARHRNGVGSRRTGSLEKYLHHTVTAHLSENATVAQERAQMRILERIGQQRFGGGISYSFLIFPSGRIYEGASVNRISYHSGGARNTRGVGIALVGNFEANKLNSKAFNAIVWLLQEGKRKGWWGDPALTSYHRQFRSTACPGKHAISRFSALNKAGRGGTVKNTAKAVTPVKAQTSTTTVGTRQTNQDKVPVRSHRNSKGNQIGTLHNKGYKVNVVQDSGSWTRIRYKHNGKVGNYWVAKAHLEPIQTAAASKTTKADTTAKSTEWPDSALVIDGKFWLITKRGYQRLLVPASVGDYRGTIDGEIGPRTVKAEQRWLTRLGYYKGLIDGDRGPRTIRALQNFLSAKGFYRGYIDGKFQTLSIKGLQRYMNTQRKYYK